MIVNELLKVREERDHTAMSSGLVWRSQDSEMETVRDLLCSRRDLDPHLWARGNGRVVGLSARAVVPVRFRPVRFRRGGAVGVDRRRLDDHLRLIIGRVTPPRVPPRTPPEGAGDDDAVTMKVAVESVVAAVVASAVAASVTTASVTTASMTHCGA